MKIRTLLHSLLVLCLLATAPSLVASDNIGIQLGPVGGVCRTVPGSGGLRVVSVAPGGPGETAGLQVGDFIYGAFGENFGVLAAGDFNSYEGSVQDYGEAIERAESGNVPLPLKVVRPGVGGLTITVTLPNAGAFGAAYPLGSPKFDALYAYAVGRMHTLATASGGSSAAGAAYNDGWFGLCLLAHPNWNDTTGPKPYRNSINKIRDWAVTRLTGAILEPLEQNQPGFVDPGLENWHLSMDSIFLSQYRLKTGDTSVDSTIQRAAELLANRVQYWQQPDLGNGYSPNHPGVMGHGGVVGDYIHTGFYAGINVINIQANMAMGLLEAAGADFSEQSGTNAGGAPQAMTLAQRRALSWEWLKSCTAADPGWGSSRGSVGYFEPQSGYDSSARTAGAVAAFHLIVPNPTADDLEKFGLMRSYLPRQWASFQNAHVASIVGVNYYQMALPRLPDRDQRYIMENTRHFYQLHRKADGSLDYFPARTDYDSDTALGGENVALINVAFTRAVAGGTLPSFPNTNTTRLNSFMKSPWVSWPTEEAHVGKLNVGTNVPLEVEIADYIGVPVTSGLTSTWSKVSGPGTVTFGNSNALTTTATFSADGLYRVQLVASKDGYTLTEPYDFTVTLNPTNPPAPTAPVVTVQPLNLTATRGGSVTFSVAATGTGPLVYQWRLNGAFHPYLPVSSSPDLVLNNVGGGVAGAYDCVVSGPGGAATSSPGSLVIPDAGSLTAGGLWQERYYYAANLDELHSLPKFPRASDSGGVITNADDPTIGGYEGCRWSGWLHVDVTGDYRLLATTYGNDCEVSLSTDQHPTNKTARVTGHWWVAGYRGWSAAPASAYVTLTAGQRYYIEVQMGSPESGGAAAVALQKQGDPLPADGTPGIPGSQLEYLIGGVFGGIVSAQAHVNPASAVAYAGRPFSFTAGSTGPSSYQWSKNNTELPGETNASLNFVSLQPGDAGNYSVVLTNFLGSATDTGTLTVLPSSPTTDRILANNPVGYWRFNENAGPTAHDYIGGHHGTAAGGVTFGLAGPTGASFPGLEAGNLGAQFNGTDAEVTIPALNLTTNTVTITGWIKRNGAQAGGTGIFYSRAAGTISGLNFGNTNELRYTWNAAFSTYTWDSGLTPPDGQWTFVALVIEPAQATLYMGTNAATLTSAVNTTTHPLQAFAGTTSIGHDPISPADRFFNGSLDEIAIFDQALTEAQIRQIISPPWLEWQTLHFTAAEILDPAISGPTADPDGDGLSNVLEYGTGTPPRSSSATPLATAPAGGLLTVRYTKNLNAPDVTLVLEQSTTLAAGSWTPVTATPTVISTANQIQTLEVTIPSAGSPRILARLRAIQ